MTQTLLLARDAGVERVSKSATDLRKIAVLISGSGSNLQALIDAQAKGELGHAAIDFVLSNRAAAYGLQRAQLAGIATEVLALKTFCDGDITPDKRLAFDAHLAAVLNAKVSDLIVCAGWMHIFSHAFLSAVHAPVINLHPALPGQFAGAHGIDDAYAAWQAGQITHTGCMVHEVIEKIDAGHVIATQTVPCLVGDTLNDLKQRMHVAEHALIVRAVRGYCETMRRVGS